ncbi:MAG TPA: cupin domain-containing protein [Mycobacterium sp.]|nr:cupin domain-containing protein [Mycobacterium sp.]
MRTSTLTAATALSLLVTSGVQAQQAESGPPDPGPAQHLIYDIADVKWIDGPGSFETGARMAILEGNPGAPGVFTMRIWMPDGFRIAPHWHPKPERVTVISGTFHLGAGDVLDARRTTPLKPGSYTAMPPGMRHYAIAEGETVVQLTSTGPWEITYVNPADDPRARKTDRD